MILCGVLFFLYHFLLYNLDAFEQLEDEEGTRQGFCHIRIQQRTGRKTITTVQGVAPEYDLKKIVRYLKKVSKTCFFSMFNVTTTLEK